MEQSISEQERRHAELIRELSRPNKWDYLFYASLMIIVIWLFLRMAGVF